MLGAINPQFEQQAIKDFCVYSSGDSSGRGGQPCNSSDAQGAANNIQMVDANDFSSEFWDWNWGQGCQNISSAGGAGAGTAAIADVANAIGSLVGVPGAGQLVSLISGIIHHGAVVHNQENELLCALVPYVAYTLGAIVASFRGGAITAAQSSQYMAQVLSQTQQALGFEAGRGSGQGLLRSIAVTNRYFNLELPVEEQQRAAATAANPVASAGAAVQQTAAQLGLPAWALYAGGAALALWLVS